jgi:hypothetical protein
MTLPSEGHKISLLSLLARWWRNWFCNHAGVAELQNLSLQDFKAIAKDVGASANELRALAGKWPDSADLLARRMAMLQLDPAPIWNSQSAVARDLQKTCSLCADKVRCEHDLQNGLINPDWRRYCANSSTLMALIEQRSKQSSNSDGQ